MLVRFARNYGWRAYAIPVLIVITVWVLVDVFRGGNLGSLTANQPATVTVQASAAADVPMRESLGPGPDPSQLGSGDQGEIGKLPAGGSYTEKGTGLYHLAGRAGEKVGQGTQKTFTYTVEVEEGISLAEYGGDDAFAAMVDATLSDPRGWISDPRFAFQHIDGTSTQKPDLRIQLTSVNSTHAACGYDIEMETSCFTSIGNRVVINQARWVRGALPFAGDLGSYRRYLINHEIGHGIGFADHVACGEDGALAPVMMQQTLSLSNKVLHSIDPTEVYPNDDKTCLYNPWPYPVAVEQ